MKLDEECKGCLYNSQLKKVQREQGEGEKLDLFKSRVKALCENPPAHYCAPLLMRDIDGIHRDVFGCGIDYSREKSLFNRLLLNLESEVFDRAVASADPVEEALKFSMAANYIDFARLGDLNEQSVDYVLTVAERAEVDKSVLQSFKSRLKTAKWLCFLHDNCGEIVMDKIFLRVIKREYPDIVPVSVVRGSPIINDVTLTDAEEVGLGKVANVVENGAGVPGTYLEEISEQTKKLLSESDVIISKGLGNLETLYGEGYNIFYAFNCKCAHIAERFNLKMWAAAFIEEKV